MFYSYLFFILLTNLNKITFLEVQLKVKTSLQSRLVTVTTNTNKH